MKKFTVITMSVITMSIIMMVLMIPFKVFAAGTIKESITVGQTKTLHVSGYEKGADNFVFTSSDPSSVDIISQNRSSYCEVKANKMPSRNPVIIHCEYKYPSTNGNYTYYMSGLMDINLTVSESGSGSGSGSSSSGDYTIKASSTSMSLDMAKGRSLLTITTGVPLSSNVYIEDNSPSGDYVSAVLDGTGAKNEAVYLIYPNKVGKQTVQFKLMQKTGTNSVSIRATVNVSFSVTCSHSYGDGKVTKEATSTSEGVMTYTCKHCGNKKTESIPTTKKTTIKSSASTVNLQPGESKTITITARGSLPDNYTFTSFREGSGYSVSWDGSWDGSSHPFTITGKEEGSGTVTVYVKDLDTEEELVSLQIKVTVKSKEKPTIKSSKGSLDLKVGESQTITITAGGKIASNYYFSTNRAASNCSTTWTGDWNNGSHPLTITGTSVGSGTLTVYLVEGNTDKVLASVNITVNVKEKAVATNTASITASEQKIVLSVGSSKTIDIAAVGNNLPAKIVFSKSTTGSGFKSGWTGSWKNRSHPLTIKGTQAGSGVITIKLKDSSTSKVLSSVSISVSVKKTGLRLKTSDLSAKKNGKVTVNLKGIRQEMEDADTWKDSMYVDVQYSLNKSFKKNIITKRIAKEKIEKSNGKMTVSKLKKKKTYYVRVRFTDGKEAASEWSNPIKIKTK